METDKILLIIDIIGIVAFSLTGTILAIKKGLDLFGVNIIAVINALGGGCLRDLMLGNLPPMMLTKPVYVVISCICATAVFFIMYFHIGSENTNKKQAYEIYETVLFFFDTLGLAAFTIDGMLMAYSYNSNCSMFIAIFMGVLTGIGGGIMRDVILQRLPLVFVKQIYALASIAGGLVYAVLLNFVDHTLAGISGFFVVVVIRCLAARFNWDLPVVKFNK